ncbi:MAG: hypothetical protein JXR94_02325 [Candidatus Hydrogenedentes bacterium]|nr:hypothetical protein [Candidatus Hydrogenedentota bacterium]
MGATRRGAVLILACLLCTACSPREPAPAPENTAADPAAEAALIAALDDIAERRQSINSVAATAELTANVAMGPVALTSKGSGQMESMRIDGTWRFRLEAMNTMSGTFPGMGDASAKMLTVCDGEVVYNEVTMMGTTRVAKRARPEDADTSAADGQALLAKLRESGDVALLPDSQMGDVPVYVLEVRLSPEAREKAPPNAVRNEFSFAKDSGIRVGAVSYDDEDKPLMSLIYSEIQINPALDPARFSYTPPEGVEVSEMKDGPAPMPSVSF